MSLPKELIRELEKLKDKGSDPKEGNIFEMVIQTDLLERIKKSQEYII